ncbi:MAG: CDGSH iron-sulfur domain-containing protein [Chloroflexi bacterium]|nr:MAG: CDGSH iron-sulfur domain-containing protein [Chloroflexota bacterium]
MASKIRARENGPYLIEGSATYTDADGNEQTTPGTTIALCRCGASANKPFCDGSHRAIDFKGAPIELHLND